MKKILLFLGISLSVVFAAQAATNVVFQEGFEGGALPEGWTQEYVSLPVSLGYDTVAFSWSVEQADSGLMYPYGAHGGTARAFARNNTGNEMRFVTRLVTPAMNLRGVFRPQIIFSHAEMAKSGMCDTLRVYYKTGPNDYWHLFSDGTYFRESVWKTDTLSVISPSAAYQFAFEITENLGRGVVLDDIIVQATPTCQDVENIVASQVHAYDALVTWTAIGAYNYFQLLLSPEAITDFDNIDTTVVKLYDELYNTGAVLENLIPETSYHVYVRSDCDETTSGFTNWVEGSFRTLKVAYLPYYENFNSAIPFDNYTSFGMADGWSYGNDFDSFIAPHVLINGAASVNSHYSVDSTAFLSLSDAVSLQPNPVTVGHYVYVASPEVVASSLQGLEVSFWATAYNYVSVGTDIYEASLLVGVMTNPADFNTFTPIDTVHVESAYLFKHFTVSLADYAGSGKYVALATDFGKRNLITVDNFSMKMADVHVPTHVKVSNVNSAGFNVSADLNGATSWEVRVADVYSQDGNVPTANVLYSQSGLTAGNVKISDASLAGKVVTVYLRAAKNGALSDWSFPVTLRVPTQMPELTDENNFTISFETSGGTQYLNTLNNVLREAPALVGPSSVFYPVTSFDADRNSYPKLSNTAPNYSGTHAVLSGVDSWFALPETQNNISELKLVFRYASPVASQPARIAVGVMTDPYDLSTFEQLAEFSTSDVTYRRGLVSFDEYQGAGKYIAFRSVNAGVASVGSSILLDELVVSKLGVCREPSNVHVAAHSNYADVTWNGGGMQAWIVAYSKSLTFADAQNRDTVYTPSYTFSNLDMRTTYYFTIEAMCNGEGIGLDGVVYDFTTPRGLPFEVSFTGSIPQGWTRSSSSVNNVFNGSELTTGGGSYGWSFSNSSYYVLPPQSGYVAYLNIYGSSCHYWLISPALNVDVPDGESMELTFDIGVHGDYSSSTSAYSTQGGPDDKFMVLVSEDGGNTWQRENAVVWSNDGHGDYVFNNLYWEGAQSVSIDFSKYIGKTLKFAFYGESTTANEDNYISIDNVLLRVRDEACGGVSNVTAVGLTSTDGRVNWQLGGINPHPALVELYTNSNFAESSLLRRDTVQGTNILYSDLTAMTRYYVRIKQMCDNDPTWTTTSFHTTCESMTPAEFDIESFDNEASIDCWHTGFAYNNGSGSQPDRVSVTGYGAVLKIEKSSTSETASDGAYAISPELLVGDTINKYQVIFDACTYSQSATNVARIVVGVVTDPSDAGNTFERMAELKLEYAADSAHMATYVIPLDNYIGDLDGNFGHYFMFLSEAGADSTNYVYIDNIQFELAQGCHQVVDLAVRDVTTESAVLQWTGNGEQFEVAVSEQLVKADKMPSVLMYRNIVDAADGINTYTMSNLQATSTYYAYVRSICGSDTSRWSAGREFKTSVGVPFYENFSESTFTEDVWQVLGLLFTGDSVLGKNMSPITTTYDPWQIATPTNLSNLNIVGLSGYAARTNSWGSSHNSWMISPEIDLSKSNGAEITLSFLSAASPYSSSGSSTAVGVDDRLGVIVSTDNGATWRRSDSYFFNISSLWKNAQRFTVDLSEYGGKSIRFAFYSESTQSNADVWIYVDSIALVSSNTECGGVRNLSASLVDLTDVRIDWRAVGTPDSVRIDLSQDPAFATIEDSLVTDTNTCVFSDLSFNATYYVRASQVGCDTSAVTSFRSAISIPYIEPFSGTTRPEAWSALTGSVRAAFNDTLPVASNNSRGWRMSTVSNGLTGNHLLGEIYAGSDQNMQWLVSPEVVLAAGDADNVGLVFDLALTGHGNAAAATNLSDQVFYVLLSSDGGNSWSESDAWRFAEDDDAYMKLSDISSTGTRVTIDLTGYKNERVCVAFYKETSSIAIDNDLHIANVQLRVLGEECDEPENLAVSDIALHSAVLTWSGKNDKPSVVEYSLNADFTSATSVLVSTGATYTLSGLASGTTYYARVKQICAENSESGYSNVATFATPIGLPYIEPFSTLSNWKRYSGKLADVFAGTALKSTTQGWKADASHNEILGEPHIYCARSNSSVWWLVSPEIDLGSATDGFVSLSFDMAATTKYSSDVAPSIDANSEFDVLVSLDGGATWADSLCWRWGVNNPNAAFDFTAVPNGAGDTYLIDFSRFVGKKVTIAFALRGSTGSLCVNINNLRLESLSSRCFGVTGVNFGSVDTAAVLTILPNDEASKWEVAYAPAGTEVTSMPSVISDTLTCTIGGLALTTNYDVYVRSICGEGDTSVWCGPYRFTTPQGIPYSDALSSLGSWSRYSGIPDSVFAGTPLVSVTSGWTATTSITNLGTPHLYCNRHPSQNYWLVSPEINLTQQRGDKGIYLSFDLALSSGYDNTTAPTVTKGHSFRVAISEDGGATWSADGCFLWSDEEDVQADYSYSAIPAGNGMAYHLDVRKFAGKKIRIAFIEGAAATGSSTVHIANVELAEYDVLCFGVDAVSIDAGGNSATVTLTSTEPAGTTWEYAFGTTGFVPSENDVVAISSTSFKLSGLSGQTSYDFYVRSVCSETDKSVWKGPYRFTTLEAAYLLPFFNSMNWGSSFNSAWRRYIVTERADGSLSLSTSTSGWKTMTGGNGFTDSHVAINTYNVNRYMFTTPYISLEEANSAELTFDLAMTQYNQSYAPSAESGHSFYVLIYEEDGVSGEDGSWSIYDGWRWSDAGTADYQYTEIPATGETYTLDLSAYLGSVIRIGFYAVSTIDSYSGGGDIDLHIRNVKVDTVATSGGSTCFPVRGMKIDSYSYTDATVIFRAPYIDQMRQLEYKVVPEYSLFSSVPSQFSDTNVVTLTNLWPSSNYEVYARLLCADSTWTEWNVTKPFVLRTSECSVITGVETVETSFNGATVRMITDAPEAAVSYQAVLVEKNGLPDYSKLVTSNTYQVTIERSLAPSTEYDVYARKICVAGDTSEWYGPFTIMSPIGVPYFDAMDWSIFSDSWTRYSGELSNLSESTSGWLCGASRSGNGFDDNHVYINTYSSYRYLLASPEISLDGDFTDVTLSFDLALTDYNNANEPEGYNQDFYVLVSTNGTWSLSQGWKWSENGGDYLYSDIPVNGATYNLDLTPYIGRSVRIGFYTVSRSNDNDLHLRNVSITEGGVSASCLGIKDITATRATLNSIDFSFAFRDDSQTALQTAEYEVSDRQDFMTILGTGIIKSATTHTITGLQPSSLYYVRMRQICDGGETSAWTRGVAMRTSYGLRYKEEFASVGDWTFVDGVLFDVVSTSVQATDYKKSGYWSRNTSTGTYLNKPQIRMNIYSSNRNGWAVSPEIDLTPNVGQGLLFAFDAAMCAYYGHGAPAVANDDRFIVAVSTDNGATWLRSNAFIWANEGDYDYLLSNLNEQYSRIFLDFSKFAGQRIRVAFYAESLESNADNWIVVSDIDFNAVQRLEYSDVVCEFADYADHGFEFTAEQLSLGENKFTYISPGFDSIVVINLFVERTASDTVRGTLCEGELFTDYDFNLQPTVSGYYRRVVEKPNGCDSIVVADLTVIPKARLDVEMDACAGTSVTINGKTYYNNAVAKDTLVSPVTGCDSIVTYYITFSDMARLTSEITRIVCVGETYNDGLFRQNQPGVYTKTTTSSTGCDSTVTLTLYAADALGFVYDTIAVQDLPYVFNGATLIEKNSELGDYVFDVDSLSTCGNAELHVYVAGNTALDNVKGESLYVSPNPARVGQQVVLMTDLNLLRNVRLSVYDAVGHLVYTSTDTTGVVPGLPAAGYYTIRLTHSGGEQHAKLLVK
ncbi:MAG: choice-of-anchor J domain-containing protein [Paludibacteraceae bacterium]|nr:choice-of-anchor J domain-containing protein [Paludibacteraceae bacterium]